MALIKCTHCGKEINNKRDKCLLCGKAIPEELRFKEENPVKETVKLDKSSAKENPENDTKNCPFCFEEIKKQARKCKHCQEYLTDLKDNEGDVQENKTIKEETSINEITSDKAPTNQGSKNMLKGFLLVLAIGFFYIIYMVNSGCENDGTCYYGVYERKGINNRFATYLWLGEINGKFKAYRFEKLMGQMISKSQADMRKTRKGGDVVSVQLQFSYDKSMDNSSSIEWNGKWNCNGCSKLISPNGEEFLSADKDFGKLNWEAFFNR
tara:strand:+ start:31 stop:828 length:798 start_codon:yes stop_codon:yes gene_type:complete